MRAAGPAPLASLPALAAALLLAGCGAAPAADPSAPAGPTGTTGGTGPTGPTGTTGAPVVVASGAAGAFQVTVRSDRAPGTGIASLEIAVATGAVAPAAVAVDLSAVRPASGLRAPVVSGPSPVSPGVYSAALAFAEAGSGGQGWTLVVGVTPEGGARAEVAFTGIAVVERRLAGLIRTGDRTLLLAVRFDGALRVGLNPVTVSLHAVDPAGGAPSPVSAATLHAVPVMPSMGHGSTGTVDPVATGVPGLHAGAIAFSMPGDWETTFTVGLDGAEAGSVATLVYF
ncbi:MAG TPA: hypothetical protein VFM53_03085 [Anaeromyxobacteraceae bacterium]|nr:hypothetical protein [Anaeromyxobacteraceae bacterium]